MGEMDGRTRSHGGLCAGTETNLILGEEMSCRQCGKKTELLCARSDCWNTESNLKAARKIDPEVKLKIAQQQAVRAFPANFETVTAWAVGIGAQRVADRADIRRMASETVRAAMTYAAIARSL